jgi:phage baseplate assembly protein W
MIDAGRSPCATGQRRLSGRFGMVRSARQIRDELKKQLDPAVQWRFAEERRAAIAEYERRYGIRSDEVHQAIEDGRLEETFEVNQWLHLVEVERLGRRGGCVPG